MLPSARTVQNASSASSLPLDGALAVVEPTDGIQRGNLLEDGILNDGTRGSKMAESLSQEERESNPQDSSLHPTDHGFHAWAYLMSAWVLDFLIWGLPFTYGVFLDFYKNRDFRDAPPGLIALPGSLCTGILCLSTIYVMPIINRFPAHKFKIMLVGYVVCVSGLIGAAFATEASHLVATQGVLYSVGGSLLYYPMMTYLFEWFVVRKGFAYGVLFSGASTGGVVMPFIIRTLLERYGRKVTLIALAITFAILILPCFPFLKPRKPIAQTLVSKRFDTKFLRRSVFWILFSANLVQASGSFMPFLYLPAFATDLNLKSTYGNLSVALINGASGPGMIFFGWLTDRYDLRYAIMLSSVGSAISVFLLWGFSQSLAPLLVLACVYGFLGPSWAALFPRFASVSVGSESHQVPTVVFCFMGGRGTGNVLSAPISAALIHPWNITNKHPYGYGLKGYGPLIVFTGVSLLTSSLAVFHYYIDLSLNLRIRRPMHRVDHSKKSLI